MALHFSRDSFYFRRLRRRRRLIGTAILLLILLLVATAVFISLFWQHGDQNSPSVIGKQNKPVNYQPYKTFTTPYFQLQTDQNWQAVPAESTAHAYVYRAFKGRLVERDLTVYVNELPPRLMLTYILPVRVDGNQFTAGSVSDHCRTAAPAAYLAKSRNPIEVTIDSVHFICQTDGTSTTIGTGLKGGSYQTALSRPNGSSAQYFLLYHDLAFNPRPQLFKDIVDSFKTL